MIFVRNQGNLTSAVMKKWKMSRALLLLACITSILVSCDRLKDDPPPGDPVPVDLTLKQKEVVDSANAFAFDLFSPIIEEADGGGEPDGLSVQHHKCTLNGAQRRCRRDFQCCQAYSEV